MEAEHFPAAGRGVAMVGEAGDFSRAFVGEAHFIGLHVLHARPEIAQALLLHRGDVHCGFFPLCLDHPYRLLLDEEDVVGRAVVSLKLPHGNTNVGVKVHPALILHHPAGFPQVVVDAVAGLLFGVLVHEMGAKVPE